MALHEGVPEECVLPTPGATAAIHLVSRAILSAGDEAAIFMPGFGEYEAAARAAGAVVRSVIAEPPSFDPLPPPRARLGFLANPNNPTGAHLDRARIEAVSEAIGGTLVVDTAYEAFVEGAWDAVDLVHDGLDVVMVRSMTKLHAIPGVRLGYIVARPEVVSTLAALQHSWSLDAVAQAVGPVAIAQHRHRVAELDSMWLTRDVIRNALQRAGFAVSPSRANFIMVEVGDASDARRRLLAEGVLVRDCTSFGLPGWIRVAVPPQSRASDVIDALLALRPQEHAR
ncbi:MAG: histidinol-phosphate aminotransferase family protein [Chloroflexi bacterium]|nr:histidinol-phosphate aminotransferase family protein [Chloroflexota bacterium]